jgi:TP901 family phage tail tape measure protein/lambda family phage tail tape measure protein
MATFRINIVVNPTSAVAGTRVVERRLARLENRANRLRRTLGLTFAALAGGAIIFGAIRNMARFAESMGVVRGVTKATADEFEALESRAQRLGITTRFTATEAADAMVLLARAGLSVAETMEAVGDTLLLAQAGGLEMAEAADITASTLRGFGLEAAEVARITDVLTETANSSNTNVSQLGQSLKFVAPIAKGLGQDIEITNAALGTLADAGLKGTLAGTGLRRVLAELASPGRELQDILNEAGLVIEDVDPKVVGLTQSLEALKLAGFDTGDALEVFGQRGGPAFAVLVDNIPKIRALEKSLKNSGGEAARVATIMDKTLAGSLFKAKSAIEGFNLALGKTGVVDILQAALLGITETFRFLARNADIVGAVLTGLAIGAIVKLSVALTAKLVPALVTTNVTAVTLTGTLGGLKAAAISTGVAIKAAIGPFVAFSVAAAAAVASLQKQADLFQEIEDASKGLELDAGFKDLGAEAEKAREKAEKLAKTPGFNLMGTRIRQAEQELRQLNKTIDEQPRFGPSPAQAARVKLLTEELARLRKATRDTFLAEKERQEGLERGAPVIEATIKRLERRRDTLRALRQESKALIEFQKQLETLEQDNAQVTTEEKARIRALIELNSKLADQKRVYEEIKGPQRKYLQDTAALKALLDKGRVSLAEFNIKMQELKDTMDRPADIQLTALDQLEEENRLLSRRLEVGEDLAEAERLLEQMKRDGLQTTDATLDRLVFEVRWQRLLREAIRDRMKAEREKQRLQDREDRLTRQVARRINIQDRLLEQAAALQRAKDQNLITDGQLIEAMEDLQLRSLEASTAMEDGFTRAFIKIRREAEDLASVGEDVANVFADTATDALVNFAETGQFSFKEFANAILQDLIRIIARLLVVQAISAFLPGAGAAGIGAAATIAQPRAEGGTVQPNRSFVVGENGPELFVPDRTGTIVPNQQQAAQPQPTTVQVINVQSEEDIPNAINEGGADESIVNALARQKDRVNQVLN